MLRFPFRTLHVLGILTAVFLVGAAAVRIGERPLVSAEAVASLAALADRIENTQTRLEVCVAATRAADGTLAAQLVALEADAAALQRAAVALTDAARRGFRDQKNNAAARKAAAASAGAVGPVRLAHDRLRAYEAGGAPAGEAIGDVERAMTALAEARTALGVLK